MTRSTANAPTSPNNQPTSESVLTSRQRAKDLRELGPHELSDAAKDLDRRVRIRVPPPDAKQLYLAIFAQMPKPDAALGFYPGPIADAGSEFALLASADLPDGRIVRASLVFCALHILKLALQDGEPIEPAIDAIEITEAS